MATSGRISRVVLALALAVAAGCHAPYQAPRGLTPNSGAIVKLHSMRAVGEDASMWIDVYALPKPCAHPEYLGRVTMRGREDDHILVPTDGPVTFVSYWTARRGLGRSECYTEMSVVPEQGRRYVVMFEEPVNGVCRSTVFEAVRDEDGETQLVKHAPFVHECPRTGGSRPYNGPPAPREH